MSIDTTESDVLEKSKTRDIVQAILDYGINNSQIYDMIKLFSMELESTDHMKQIVSLVTDLQKPSKSPIITKE